MATYINAKDVDSYSNGDIENYVPVHVDCGLIDSDEIINGTPVFENSHIQFKPSIKLEEILEISGDKPMELVFENVERSPVSVQLAILRLMDDHKNDSIELDDNVIIVLEFDDNAHVVDAIKNRLVEL